MTKVIFESKANRKAVYKTEKGIEIKPMLHSKKVNSKSSTNITFYYVEYRLKNNNWEILTNKNLYGETKTIDTFDSRDEAIKTANAINKSIHLLFENI